MLDSFLSQMFATTVSAKEQDKVPVPVNDKTTTFVLKKKTHKIDLFVK